MMHTVPVLHLIKRFITVVLGRDLVAVHAATGRAKSSANRTQKHGVVAGGAVLARVTLTLLRKLKGLAETEMGGVLLGQLLMLLWMLLVYHLLLLLVRSSAASAVEGRSISWSKGCSRHQVVFQELKTAAGTRRSRNRSLGRRLVLTHQAKTLAHTLSW